MSRIRGKDTKPEMLVRQRLFAAGWRFRVCDRRFIGRPDIVIARARTIIDIRGCFWHRHPFCKLSTTPKTHPEYWQKKFEVNVRNDQKHYEELAALGWNVIVIWECEVKKDLEINMQRIKNDLEENYIRALITPRE